MDLLDSLTLSTKLFICFMKKVKMKV